MDRLPNDIDQEAVDGLSSEEMASLLIAYAQENSLLESENKRLTHENKALTDLNKTLEHRVSIVSRLASSHLQYIQDVRGAETAIRRFCADPAIAPYIPSLGEVIASLFGDPKPYGGDGDA